MTHEAIDDVLKALRDELAGVAPSPEFASRVSERVAGELPLLREELAAVAPSPEFRARVRQQIETAGPVRGASWPSGWRWLVPLAAAAGVVIAVAIMSRGSKDAPAPATSTVDRVKASTPTGPSTDTARPTASDRRTPSTTAASLLRTSPAKPAEGPSLEVITNQPAILKAMRARIAADVQMVEPTTTPVPETAPEIVVPAIEVSPIVVKSMVVQPRSGGLLAIIRIITAQ